MQSKQITRRQKKKQTTENVINSELTLGLKGGLGNKAKALTKGKRLKMAADNEKH